MPIDPTGTKPGLVPEQPKEEAVNMKCKGKNCPSIRAFKVHIPGTNARMYRCAECGHMWGINIGGPVDL
jgi:transposase-like protein